MINQDREFYESQIEELKSKLKKKEEEITSIKKEADKRVNDLSLSIHLKSMLGKYKTTHDEVSQDAKDAVVKALVDVELNNAEAEFYFTEFGKLDIRRKDGTSLLSESHRKIDPDMFLEMVLSRNKLLVPAENEKPSGEGTTTHLEPNSVLRELAKQSQSDYNNAFDVMAAR